jgi:phospholipase/carboxylesterase
LTPHLPEIDLAMNRIPLWSQSSAASSSSAESHIEQARLQSSTRRGLHYTLFSPIHYEQKYNYPLVIWLHGDGDDERQLNRVMPLISMRNYVALAPRGPSRGSADGFMWGQGDRDVSQAGDRVLQSIETAGERFNVAERRIFIAGLQSGGTMAFRIALNNPQRFAGVLSVAGPFPERRSALTRLDEARQLPMFIAHGRYSELYPESQACDEMRLFHVAGLSVTFRQYPCKEDVDVQMLHDMDIWMMDRITGVDMTAPNQHPLRPGDSN